MRKFLEKVKTIFPFTKLRSLEDKEKSRLVLMRTEYFGDGVICWYMCL